MWLRRRRAIWPEKSRNRAQTFLIDTIFIRFVEEGTQYLLIANGAVLIATISGIGNAWQYPALQQAFTHMVTLFTSGLCFSVLAWIAGKLSVQSLFLLKKDIADQVYTPATWRKWHDFNGLIILCAIFGFLGVAALL